MSNVVNRKIDFILLFDVENGNPNGDPDAGNMPRMDAETGIGLVSDVCLKRKVRNYVQLLKDNEPGYDIYVTEGAVLNNQHKKAYDALDLKPESKKLPKDKEKARQITEFMNKNFFDIRTFGAVMTNEVNGGQVRGPVQFNFSKSIDIITPQSISMTRMAVTNEKDEEKEKTFGSKWIVPYALYKMTGHISAAFAQKSGFTEEDLELLWSALINMFEHDHSASRGLMSARKLIVFEHDTKLGNAPAHKLFDLVEVSKKDTVVVPRSYKDYEVKIFNDKVPNGVTLIEKL